jgi:hypothetical protein
MYSPKLSALYVELYSHLAAGETTNFECLGGSRPEAETEGQSDPYAEDSEESVPLEPPGSVSDSSA